MPSMDAKVVRLVQNYREALLELTFNSKPIITNLTIIAGEQEFAAANLVSAVEEHIFQAPLPCKLPGLYLVDSIVKNVGRVYTQKFSRNIAQMFMSIYRQGDSQMQVSMMKLQKTWRGVFPDKVLQEIQDGLAAMQQPSQRPAAVQPTRDPQRDPRARGGGGGGAGLVPPGPPGVGGGGMAYNQGGMGMQQQQQQQQQGGFNMNMAPQGQFQGMGMQGGGGGYGMMQGQSQMNGGYSMGQQQPGMMGGQQPQMMGGGQQQGMMGGQQPQMMGGGQQQGMVGMMSNGMQMGQQGGQMMGMPQQMTMQQGGGYGVQQGGGFGMQQQQGGYGMQQGGYGVQQQQQGGYGKQQGGYGAPMQMAVPQPTVPALAVSGAPAAAPVVGGGVSAAPPASDPLALLQMLAAQGVLKSAPALDPSPAAGTPPGTPPVDSAPADPSAAGGAGPGPQSLGIEPTSAALRDRREWILDALYWDKPKQCKTCGLRFPDGPEHTKHLDWHFIRKRKLREGAVSSRKWFLDGEQWMTGATKSDEDKNPNFFEEQEKAKLVAKEHSVLLDEEHENCALCGEKFELVWNQDDDDWHCKNAVRLDAPTGSAPKGAVVHVKCLPSQQEAGTPPPEVSTPPPEASTPPPAAAAEEEEEAGDGEGGSAPAGGTGGGEVKQEGGEGAGEGGDGAGGGVAVKKEPEEEEEEGAGKDGAEGQQAAVGVKRELEEGVKGEEEQEEGSAKRART